MNLDAWDGMEWKVRHVRTAEGARRYGKPIGSPITAADRALARARSAAGNGGGGSGGESPAPSRRRGAAAKPAPEAAALKERVTPTAPKRSNAIDYTRRPKPLVNVPATQPAATNGDAPRINYVRPQKRERPVAPVKSTEERLSEISGSKKSAADRMKDYRSLLTESGDVGTRKVNGKTERDVADDGGPGETTMRQHDVVMSAGKDLHDELIRRVDAAMKSKGSDAASLERRAEVARGEIARVQADLDADRGKAQDRAAAKLGLGSERDMRSALLRGDAGARENYKKMRAEAENLGDVNLQREHERAVAEARKIELERQQAKKVRASVQRDEALKLLAETRTMNNGSDENGFDYDIVSGFPGELKRTMRTAESRYPQEWIDRLKSASGGKMTLGENERGYYDDDNHTLMISRGPIGTSDGKALDAVAVHELGHGMEASIPGLVAMQDAFLWSRTSEGDIGNRKRTGPILQMDNEPTYADDFIEPYTGKVYAWDSRELFTTQMESLFAGSGYEDDGTRAWTLGVLSML